MNIIIATGNNDKVREINELLAGTEFEAFSMKSQGINPEIIEDADSFEGNALIKAREVHKYTDGYVMADDSGLCVEGLDGAPGIYSARFAGEDSSYEEKFALLYKMLEEKGVPKDQWYAKFVCAIAVVRPDGSEFTVRGECKGLLLDAPQGENGFGYDPIFYMPEFGMTTAQMDPEQKNQISHRGKALRQMVEKLTI